MAAALIILLHYVFDFDGRRNMLAQWALDELLKGRAFGIENLSSQHGVSFIQNLQAISRSSTICVPEWRRVQDKEEVAEGHPAAYARTLLAKLADTSGYLHSDNPLCFLPYPGLYVASR